jgi:hypothetical protein
LGQLSPSIRLSGAIGGHRRANTASSSAVRDGTSLGGDVANRFVAGLGSHHPAR